MQPSSVRQAYFKYCLKLIINLLIALTTFYNLSRARVFELVVLIVFSLFVHLLERTLVYIHICMLLLGYGISCLLYSIAQVIYFLLSF